MAFGGFGWGGVGSDRTLGEEHWAPGSTLTRLHGRKDRQPGRSKKSEDIVGNVAGRRVEATCKFCIKS